tara:strand:- start:34038 stop:34400 length:363 start_codon:yes stop_codon:yes gene_type:complete
MKIRIKGNTIRYRLTKSEVEAFCDAGYFLEQTQFATTIFSYELNAKEGISGLEADYTNNTITVYFPKKETKNWATNSIVGFDNNYKTIAGKELSILVEKDFVCMDETVEDQSDNYPNPKA